MAAMGLKWDGPVVDDTVWVFPENERAVSLFFAMQTQARIVSGFSGESWRGFDYSAVPAVMKLIGIRGSKGRRSAFEKLRVMESVAIEELSGHG